ncbi:MAG: hypothetical protein JNL66_00465 [Alphaproteobacteria bacterium]|nr:hypothetical protein [Alphaproteobacteria bacterium]
MTSPGAGAGPTAPKRVSALKHIYWEVSAGRGFPGEYLPDWLCLIQRYYLTFGAVRLFIRPRTFTERLFARMVWARDPRITATSEKVNVRDFVAARVGPDYLIPLLKVWEQPEEIVLDALPDQFALKASHASGFNLLVGDKAKVDVAMLRETMRRWLAIDWYRVHREWGYKGIPRRIMAEALILDRGELPADYKFYVFNGRARMVMVNSPAPRAALTINRGKHLTRDFFDETWRPLRVRKENPRAAVRPAKPARLDEMVRVAGALGADFPFCRVDLYQADGKVYFGEITHYPSAGRQIFTPADFDAALGEVWRTGAPIPERFFDPDGGTAGAG